MFLSENGIFVELERQCVMFIGACIIYRFNLTNSEEPYFLVESLEALHSIDGSEDRSFRVVIYSVNQKGRSPKVVLKDLLIGDRDHHSASKWSFLFKISCEIIIERKCIDHFIICMIFSVFIFVCISHFCPAS